MPRTTKHPAPQASQAPLSIPAADREAKPSAADLLASLGGKRKPAAKAKAERPVLELSPEGIEDFKEWVSAKILFDHFESHLKTVQTALDEELVELWLQIMWQTKTPPVNPTLKVPNERGLPDFEAMFVVTERFRIEVPEITEDDDRESVVAKMIDAFVRLGLNKDKATQMVQNEFIIREEKTIPITELMEGRKQGKEFIPPTAAGKSAAEKLIYAIVMGTPLNLTQEEQQSLIVSTNFQISVKGGFLNRVATYCDTFEQLKSVLKFMVKPTYQHRGAKLGISDSLEERNRRLIAAAANILGGISENE